MSYEYVVLAFVLTRLPISIGAWLLLAAAVRQWRWDQVVAGLLVAGAGLLLLSQLWEFPVRRPGVQFGGLPWGIAPLWFWWSSEWESLLMYAHHITLAGAAACGLAATFLRRAPLA